MVKKLVRRFRRWAYKNGWKKGRRNGEAGAAALPKEQQRRIRQAEKAEHRRIHKGGLLFWLPFALWYLSYTRVIPF